MEILLLLLAGIVAAGISPASGSYKETNCASGRHAFVHLFEWKWTDIAAECERFLAPKGFGAVQVSPPNEHSIVTNPLYPWYERYQPVSYKLVSRSGTEQEFTDMVHRCNNVGVRIYVDAVINHMVGAGTTGTGTAGSSFDGNTLDFPGVPYAAWDFNGSGECNTGSGNIENYGDVNQVRNCRLVSLLDLKLSTSHVRNAIAGYLNHLISIGVAGFRFDASKHMWPVDIDAILALTNNLNTNYFPSNSRPFIYQEVIDMGNEPIKASEYLNCGRVTNFIYGDKLATGVRGNDQLKWFHNFGEAWGMMNTNDVVVFIDNHDNQRGHGAGGANILTFWESRLYKVATVFMLAHPYGYPRIMSSYNWNRNFVNGKDINDWVGPPSDGGHTTKDVSINADQTCGNGWICEHRWRQITNMVAFRNIVTGHALDHWWDNGNYQIAFARGSHGFLAINLDNHQLNLHLHTGLPSGHYCDVISGSLENGACTGKDIHVDHHGKAHIHIHEWEEDPMIAIHIGAIVGSRTKVAAG